MVCDWCENQTTLTRKAPDGGGEWLCENCYATFISEPETPYVENKEED